MSKDHVEALKGFKTFQSYLRSPYRSLKHSTYFFAYDWLFGRYVGKPITFVEIGVLGGGSLFMWRDFFGPQARIIGVDLNPNAQKWREHGFEIYTGSQSDPDFWAEFSREVGAIDVVLDDGGHTYQQQIVTCECLLPSVKDGGMMVVEDTHTSYMEGFGDPQHSFMEYVKRLIDAQQRRNSKVAGATDERFWSVEIFESIVALKVHSGLAKFPSFPTSNGGLEDENAIDFRDRDDAGGGLDGYFK